MSNTDLQNIHLSNTTTSNNLHEPVLYKRYACIKNAIAACKSAQNVRLLAVSKTQSADDISALAKFGQQDFAENYLQEALDKQNALKQSEHKLIWHYIGHIQRNKTTPIAQNFSWVHTISRAIIADRLNKTRAQCHKNTGCAPLNVCIQVNIDDENSKSGCQISELAPLIKHISTLPFLRLRGLMIIPQKDNKDAFLRAEQLFSSHKIYHQNPSDWDSLSMGMSGDFEAAIASGATMVRIGTALFGARD